MSFWSSIKNKLGIGRRFYKMDVWVGGKLVDLDTFIFTQGIHYVQISGNRLNLYHQIDVKFSWRYNGKDRVEHLKIEPGFVYDGASIPRIARPFIGDPLDINFALASCIHDKACVSNIDHYPESRMFYEVLKSQEGKLGLPKWKEKAMYISVLAYSWVVG